MCGATSVIGAVVAVFRLHGRQFGGSTTSSSAKAAVTPVWSPRTRPQTLVDAERCEAPAGRLNEDSEARHLSCRRQRGALARHNPDTPLIGASSRRCS